jgi:hypothetical protein
MFRLGSRSTMTTPCVRLTPAGRRRDGEYRRGPLHGIPVAVKDVIDIAGQRTRAGSRSREQMQPAIMNADIVAILRAAGAVILGKTHTTEYAYFDGPPPTGNPQPPNLTTKREKTDIPTLLSADILALRPQAMFAD